MRINYELLRALQSRPHPLLHIEDDLDKQLRETPVAWLGEVFHQARTVHHLLDMVGIARGTGYACDLDSRAMLAVSEILTLRYRLSQIGDWHVRESAPGGMVGDFCVECGMRWPCDTRRMADGTHEDLRAVGHV